MNQSKKISKISTSENLEFIQKSVCKITEERVRAAVESLTPKKMNQILSLFSQMNNGLVLESDELKAESDSYNSKYATLHNGRYSTCYNLLGVIKKQIFFLYKIINSVACKPNRKAVSAYVDVNSIEFDVNHSLIGSLPYENFIFEDKTPTQQRLIEEIAKFLSTLDENLELCKQTVEKEERIGNDESELSCRFYSQLDEIIQYLKGQKNKCPNCNDEFYQDLISVRENPGVLKKWWHKIDPSDMTKVAIGIQFMNIEKYSAIERRTFDNDCEKMELFRKVLACLDSKYEKITGDLLYYIYKYTGCKSSQNRFHKCFDKTYRNIGGKLYTVTYTSVASQRLVFKSR